MRKRLKKKIARRQITIIESCGCVFCDLGICTAEKHIDTAEPNSLQAVPGVDKGCNSCHENNI